MKKWQRRYFLLTLTVGILFCATWIIIKLKGFSLWITSEKTDAFMQKTFAIYVSASIIIYILLHVVSIIKRAFHNTSKYDDSIFRKIDEYKECWGEDNCGYIRRLQIINLCYGADGDVEKLVDKREISRLLARADYLKDKIELDDYLIGCANSLFLSVIASFVINMMDSDKLGEIPVWAIVIIIAFFGIVLKKYEENSQERSHKKYIYQYELALLSDKIKKLENTLKITADDEKVINTQRIVIHELNKIRKREISKRKRLIIEKDIKQVSSLNLCIGEYRDYYLQIVYISNSECFLVYDSKKDERNKNMSELNLINQDYSILYQIMNKYNMVSSS